MRYLIVILLLFCCGVIHAGNGIPVSKIDCEAVGTELSFAFKLWQENRIKQAMDEIESKLKSDSALLSQAAIITGGNYHLIRLTDNIFADRVGGFSPSGTRLVYSQDTFTVHLDDGIFDWVDKRNTGVAYYDFETGKETTIDTRGLNAVKPCFQSDTSFFYIASERSDSDISTQTTLFLYNLNNGTSTKCFPFNTQEFCAYGDEVAFYDMSEGAIIMKDATDLSHRVLYDNYGFLNHRRPLSMIRNFSAGDNIIMFQAGYRASSVRIYSVPSEGGAVKIMSDEQITWNQNTGFYPAAVDSNDYAYLLDGRNGLDIYYHTQNKDYRLTYDGGDKSYLNISSDGIKIAYSYKSPEQNVESYEIFILDFSLPADETDIMYRFKVMR